MHHHSLTSRPNHLASSKTSATFDTVLLFFGGEGAVCFVLISAALLGAEKDSWAGEMLRG